jgi:hypothetical protein
MAWAPPSTPPPILAAAAWTGSHTTCYELAGSSLKRSKIGGRDSYEGRLLEARAWGEDGLTQGIRLRVEGVEGETQENDEQIVAIFAAIWQPMSLPEAHRKRISPSVEVIPAEGLGRSEL